MSEKEVFLSAPLEAILFAAAKPLELETLIQILETDEETLLRCLDYYEKELMSCERGIRLNRTGAGIELVSAPEFSNYVTKIREKKEVLTKVAMETLAVIAFKQPVTKAEVEEIRGVNSEKVIKQLVERDLIQELGRKESIGRPVLYGTTDTFLRSVGIESVEDLKFDLDRLGTISVDDGDK